MIFTKLGVTIIIIRNGLSKPNSNPGLGCVSLYAIVVRKGMNPSLQLWINSWPD